MNVTLPPPAISITVEAEETVFADRYSNNGAGPMWCYSGTCLARVGEHVFVSATERLPGEPTDNDCRWVLMQRGAHGWERKQADEEGRQREPCPLGCLPDGRIFLSSNPTLNPPGRAGGGPAMPEWVEFAAARPDAPCRRGRPGWRAGATFQGHSYRSMAVDAARGEAVLFQNSGYSTSEWALLKADGKWIDGQLNWPPHAKTDLAPFGASHARVNYPVVIVRDRAVHFCGAVAYDNWDRVRRPEDLGLGFDPNARGSDGMAGRQRGNRFRRLLYSRTADIADKPFSDWIEIDNTFADGGWLFPGDMHLDAAGLVHLLWYRAPMLRTLRDERYPDIQRVYSIEYATLRDGKVLSRQTLVRAGDGYDAAIPTDLDREGMPYVGPDGARIVGNALATPRFHITPDGRILVVYYVSDGGALSENRIIEVFSDGTASAPATLPMKHPLTQFFTATPRAGCAPSWTLDLLGHRRGDWRHREGSDLREYEGIISYARVRLAAGKADAP